MNIDWKLLSYAMFISAIVAWISALILSIVVIQPLLDIWKHTPQYFLGNVSVTIAQGKSCWPIIPMWVLLLLLLLFWCSLTFVLYVIMRSFKKHKQ